MRLQNSISNRPTRRIQRYAVLVLVCHLLGGASLAWADGFRNPLQGSKAMGQGLAFIAQADNPSAIHFNPAGLVQLSGVHLSLGVQLINLKTTFRPSSGETVTNDVQVVGYPPPGQLFLTAQVPTPPKWPIQQMTFGLGVESLFGFGKAFPQDSPFAAVITKAEFPLLDIKPTMAVRLHKNIAIGLGADIFTFASFLGEGQLEQHFRGLGNIPGTGPGDDIELNGKGTTVGMNASLLVTVLRNAKQQPILNVGLIWRSQAVLPLKGELLANGVKVANANISYRLPESYEAGVAVWPIRNHRLEWKVELDVHYVRWKSIKNLDITLSNGTVLPQPQRWKNAFTIGVGTEGNWLAPWQLIDWEIATRMGYTYLEEATTDVSFNPALTDGNTHIASVGMGFHCTRRAKWLGFLACGNTDDESFGLKSMSLDLAYQFAVVVPRTVRGHAFPGINGQYDHRVHIGSVTLAVSF